MQVNILRMHHDMFAPRTPQAEVASDVYRNWEGANNAGVVQVFVDLLDQDPGQGTYLSPVWYQILSLSILIYRYFLF